MPHNLLYALSARAQESYGEQLGNWNLGIEGELVEQISNTPEPAEAPDYSDYAMRHAHLSVETQTAPKRVDNGCVGSRAYAAARIRVQTYLVVAAKSNRASSVVAKAVEVAVQFVIV